MEKMAKSHGKARNLRHLLQELESYHYSDMAVNSLTKSDISLSISLAYVCGTNSQHYFCNTHTQIASRKRSEILGTYTNSSSLVVPFSTTVAFTSFVRHLKNCPGMSLRMFLFTIHQQTNSTYRSLKLTCFVFGK
jgi:hypothetical protein